MTSSPLSHLQVFKLAVPVMLSQAAIASTGVVDTAVMGLYGSKADIGAVGIATVTVNFIYWAFGFLRMSTTGMTAQAVGRGDTEEIQAILQRAMMTGLALGLCILTLSALIQAFVFRPFTAEPEVINLAKDYWLARVWGAPAILMSYGISGWLLGTGRTGQLLALQIVLNLVNCALDVWFVAGLDFGPAGLGAGTAIAEWCAVVFGLMLVRDNLKPAHNLFNRTKLLALFSANRDVMIRTLALLFVFVWFTNSGSSLGTAILAGNQILLQFITVSAYVLDGFAFIAEKEVGEAYGSRERQRLKRAMRVTTELALGFGLVIGALYLFTGGWMLEHFIQDTDARDIALQYLPYCAAVPVIGVLCWQLDGFFLGATQGKALRNSGIVTTAVYIVMDLSLRSQFGNAGVWSALLMFYVIRAFSLGLFLPALFQQTQQSSDVRR